uniref:hypothetical protein n=1 Tax=Leisingera caerulea TaxID=506591 RepID=UPI0004850C6A|nr:hypothetical protein [Leisingera caerulea]
MGFRSILQHIHVNENGFLVFPVNKAINPKLDQEWACWIQAAGFTLHPLSWSNLGFLAHSRKTLAEQFRQNSSSTQYHRVMSSAPSIELSAIRTSQPAAVLALLQANSALKDANRRLEHLVSELIRGMDSGQRLSTCQTRTPRSRVR